MYLQNRGYKLNKVYLRIQLINTNNDKDREIEDCNTPENRDLYILGRAEMHCTRRLSSTAISDPLS